MHIGYLVHKRANNRYRIGYKKINIGRSLVHSSRDEQQPITGSDISDTPAQELALFRWKGIRDNGWIHLN